MLIVLLRHGPAATRDEKKWPDDGQRPLTERGKERTRLASNGLARVIPSPDRIYTSPLVRAVETARIFGDAAGIERVDTLEALSPGSPMIRIHEALAKHRGDATIVLVGHEPDLGLLAGHFVGGAPLPLKKAGACAITLEGKPRARGGDLRWLLAPSILRRLGRKKARA
jgi:phosphohistidine phosphatase